MEIYKIGINPNPPKAIMPPSLAQTVKPQLALGYNPEKAAAIKDYNRLVEQARIKGFDPVLARGLMRKANFITIDHGLGLPTFELVGKINNIPNLITINRLQKIMEAVKKSRFIR